MSDESFYQYDLAVLGQSIDALRSMLPPSELYYSVKANAHPDIIRRCVQRGLSIEVSSIGELDAAITAGAVAEDIVCTGPGKSDQYLLRALELGSCISVESAQEIDRLNLLHTAHPSRVLVRINASKQTTKARLQMTGVASQFGIDEDQAPEAIQAVVDGPHQFAGVHLYMGSNVDSEDDLVEQFQTAMGLAVPFESLAQGPYLVDLGGGFGHPFARPGARPEWSGLRQRLESALAAHPGWRVAFESGRFIAGACGTLTIEIKEVKWSKGVRYAVASSGVNHLGGLSGLRRIPSVRAQSAGAHEATHTELSCLVGPLCTPVDVLSPRFEGACEVGDRVTIPNVGAYGLNASLANFLGHPYPVEIVVDGTSVVSRTRQTVIRERVDE